MRLCACVRFHAQTLSRMAAENLGEPGIFWIELGLGQLIDMK
ncbi:hypothetical protein OAJ61_00150 [bacterium]|nr:hypothetical protein [bacterium]